MTKIRENQVANEAKNKAQLEQMGANLDAKLDAIMNGMRELKVDVLEHVVSSTPSSSGGGKRRRMPSVIQQSEMQLVQEAMQGENVMGTNDNEVEAEEIEREAEGPQLPFQSVAVALRGPKDGFRSMNHDRAKMSITQMLRLYIEHDLFSDTQWLAPINSKMKQDFTVIAKLFQGILTAEEKVLFKGNAPHKGNASEVYEYSNAIEETCKSVETRIMTHIHRCKEDLDREKEQAIRAKNPTKSVVTAVASVLNSHAKRFGKK